MKQEFKIISDFIEKNTKVLDCWLWGWNINGVFTKHSKEINIRGN